MDLLDDLVAPDLVRHCQATPWVQIRSREDFRRFLQDDWAAVPDRRVSLRFLVAEGEHVAVYCTFAGTHTGQWGPIPLAEKRFELDFSGEFRMADGKISELRVTWDNLAVLTQLGHWPPASDVSSSRGVTVGS